VLTRYEVVIMPALHNGSPSEVPEGKIVWDDEIKGFGVKCAKGGKRSWVFSYRSPRTRKSRQITLASCSVIESASRAREQARLLAQVVLDGNDPLDIRKKEKERRMTVGELLDLYLARHLPTLKPKSQTTILGYLNNRVRPTFGRLTLEEVSPRAIREGYDRLHARYKPHGARLYVEWFRTVWNWGRKREIVEPGRNPFYGIEWKVRREPRKRKLSRREYVRVWQEVLHGEYPGVHWSCRAAIHFILLTGVRKGQALRIAKNDILWPEGRIRLHGKMRDEEDVVITPRLAAFLKSILDRSKSPWLFPSPYSANEHLKRPDEFWWELRRRAGVGDVTIHDLRRSFISMSRVAGVSLDDASVVIGHRDVKVTRDHYYSLDEEERAEAAAKIAEAIASLAEDGHVNATVQIPTSGPSQMVIDCDNESA
jgi:integrase